MSAMNHLGPTLNTYPFRCVMRKDFMIGIVFDYAMNQNFDFVNDVVIQTEIEDIGKSSSVCDKHSSTSRNHIDTHSI